MTMRFHKHGVQVYNMKRETVEIKLGMKARDIVTGLEGIITARTEFLNGCVRYIIQPPMNKKDNSVPNESWFDQQQIEIIGDGIKLEKKQTGGPVTIHVPKGLRG